LQDYKLVNENLAPKAIIEILAFDDPGVCDEDGSINLELEMTFLEFFEALVGCSERYVTESVVKDPSTPRPSTILSREQSMMSLPMSPSRVASQVSILFLWLIKITQKGSKVYMGLINFKGFCNTSVSLI
jgi:hypothetical protein